MRINRILSIIGIAFLFTVSVLFTSACQSEQKQTSEEMEEVEEIPEIAESTETTEQAASISPEDSAFMQSLIEPLKGIDKFFVGNSFSRLRDLLKHKEDEQWETVSKMLQNIDEAQMSFYIEKYLPRNGYISFVPGPVEVFVDMVYWNVSDGSQLIATQSRACGPVCDDLSISFQRYSGGVYTDAEGVIPEVRTLSTRLVPNLEELEKQDPFEFYFEFPIEGKDLKYCLDGGDCLTLTWADGVFE